MQENRFAIVYKAFSATKSTESAQKGNSVKSTAGFKGKDSPGATLSTKRKGWAILQLAGSMDTAKQP